MAASNITRFNLQALRAVAFMYGSHPALVDIDHDTISAPDEKGIRPADDEWAASKQGTIKWLYDNGLIRGDLIESNPMEGVPSAALMNAQLTSRALRILQSEDKNLGGALGDAAVAMSNGPQQDVAAAQVVKRLLEG